MSLVHNWLDHRARCTPKAIALKEGDQALSYESLNQIVSQFCERLRVAGVQPKQRLCVLMSNSVGYVVLIHAAMRLGAVLVPLNIRLNSKQLRVQIEHVGCDWLIHDDAHQSRIDPLTESDAKPLNWDQLPTSPQRHNDFSSSELDLDSTATLVFTSGSSGHPKAVRLSWANHFWSATGAVLRLGHARQDRYLLCMPLYHVGGLALVIRACLLGGELVVLSAFDADAVAAAIEEHQVSAVSLVPTMLFRLMPLWSQHFPKSLRCVLLGGAPVPQSLLREALELGLPIATTYGLTEAASQVATMPPQRVHKKPGSVGRALRWCKVNILDEAGKALETNEIGQIAVRGPTVMGGYERHATATQKALRQNWLMTGDLGYLDHDGDLWVVDRRTDLIVCGGENVYPSEVEAVLALHPEVTEACVVGVRSQEWGQCVGAVVVLKAGAVLSESQMNAFCKARLARYQCPRHFQFVKELPKTTMGKRNRRQMARLFERAG